MTIGEALIKKHETEQRILEMLVEFTQQTELSIKNVNIVTHELLQGPDRPVKFTITVEL